MGKDGDWCHCEACETWDEDVRIVVKKQVVEARNALWLAVEEEWGFRLPDAESGVVESFEVITDVLFDEVVDNIGWIKEGG